MLHWLYNTSDTVQDTYAFFANANISKGAYYGPGGSPMVNDVNPSQAVAGVVNLNTGELLGLMGSEINGGAFSLPTLLGWVDQANQ